MRGDDAALVCATWNFASHARTGRKATLVRMLRTKYFPYPHYLIQVQQPTGQRAKLFPGRKFAVGGPIAWRIAGLLQPCAGNGSCHCHRIDGPSKHAQPGIPL